jgi:hypothetical protein
MRVGVTITTMKFHNQFAEMPIACLYAEYGYLSCFSVSWNMEHHSRNDLPSDANMQGKNLGAVFPRHAVQRSAIDDHEQKEEGDGCF